MNTDQQIDQPLAIQTICAAIQCYRALAAGAAFSHDPLKHIMAPDGWVYRDYWMGQNTFDKHNNIPVLFGLVFESVAQPGKFMFAFRGTKGIHEWVDDFHIGDEAFKPFAVNSSIPVPSGVKAEDGFSEIYYSMQANIFALLDQYKPQEVIITGHSLGSALAELFTLDSAISRPDLKTRTIDFACPRTGNEDFANFYNSLTTDNPTLRVVNTKDIVPKVPPSEFGYRHVGYEYTICFEKDDKLAIDNFLFPDYGVRHGADNYIRALCKRFGIPKCTCLLEGKELAKLKYC